MELQLGESWAVSACGACRAAHHLARDGEERGPPPGEASPAMLANLCGLGSSG